MLEKTGVLSVLVFSVLVSKNLRCFSPQNTLFIVEYLLFNVLEKLDNFALLF